MDVIQDTSENMTFLKKDTVFARLNFSLDSGSFKLLCPNPVVFGPRPEGKRGEGVKVF